MLTWRIKYITKTREKAKQRATERERESEQVRVRSRARKIGRNSEIRVCLTICIRRWLQAAESVRVRGSVNVNVGVNARVNAREWMQMWLWIIAVLRQFLQAFARWAHCGAIRRPEAAQGRTSWSQILLHTCRVINLLATAAIAACRSLRPSLCLSLFLSLSLWLSQLVWQIAKLNKQFPKYTWK